jgi:flagellar biosynthesis/type III secretory pathway M-ring protein FliF/YscJ
MDRHLVVTQRPPGDVERMSLAVVVDDDHVVKKAGGTQTVSRKPRTPEELQKLQALVATAVGLDPMRGDQITVQNMSFDEVPEEEPVPMTTIQQITQYRNELWEGARIAGGIGTRPAGDALLRATADAAAERRRCRSSAGAGARRHRSATADGG